MVLADSHRISLSPWYLGYFQEPIVFAYEAITLYGCIFQNDSANESVYSLIYSKLIWKSHNTCDATIRVFNTPQGLDCFHFARRYSGNHYCFIFHQVLRCFSSLSLLFCTYVFSAEYYDITRNRLPHSEIPGSKIASIYPRLIAGNHVLLRLLVPRHPPCALSNFYQKSLSIQIELSDLLIQCRIDKLVYLRKNLLC